MNTNVIVLVLASLLSCVVHQCYSQNRIVGGFPALVGYYGYTVQVRYDGRPICGGTLVSLHAVVTAAHCVEWATVGRVSIKAGATYLNGFGGLLRTASEIIVHPNYDMSTLDNDIAVLKFTCPISGRLIYPINYHLYESIPEGSYANALGWGYTSEGGTQSEQLQIVNVPLVPHSQCSDSYEGYITDNMLCAGTTQMDACQGDSGGPLVYGGDTLIGVTSWGYGCGNEGYPGVYADVNALVDFLDNVLT